MTEKLIDCTKCNQYPELTHEQILQISEILYTTNAKMANIILMLNAGSGKCPKDGQNHTVKLNIEYLKRSNESAKNILKIKSIEESKFEELKEKKTKADQIETELQNLKNNIKELESEYQDAKEKLNDTIPEFEKVTKTRHPELWT